jgi:hypothetical protein
LALQALRRQSLLAHIPLIQQPETHNKNPMKVICTLHHASELINGIRFDKHALGRISEEITQEQAKALLAIPGYVEEFKGGGKAAAQTAQLTQPAALIPDQTAKQDNFLPSSFDDGQAMSPTLQDASPGWEKNDPAGAPAPVEGKSADKKK